MYHQTHHPSGRHRHDAVFDWRLLRPREADKSGLEQPRPQALPSRQLDILYSQLEDLKTNMREKQISLANIIEVQKKKIESQGSIILHLDQRLKLTQQQTSQESQDFVFRELVPHSEAARSDPVKTAEESKITPAKATVKNFRELYQRAQDNTRRDAGLNCEEVTECQEDDDDSDDSFITIDEDCEDSCDDSGGSDSTLENSQSTDSGFHTDSNGSSYGVNPLFSLQPNDGTEACQDDFVFFNQKKDEMKTSRRDVTRDDTILSQSQQKSPSSSQLLGSLKKSHRIVIINNETALI